jgi:serine/threonine protein kinase
VLKLLTLRVICSIMPPEVSEDDAFSIERETIPNYGQTQSFEIESGGKGSGEPEQQPTRPPPRWKYHNLDSSLLEFLAFLAEHNVPVARIEDVTFDENKFGRGTTKEVLSGSWLDQPVAVKRLGRVVSKPGYTLEEQKSLKDRSRAFEKLLKDLMFEIQIMKHPQLAKHPNIVELIAVAFEDSLVAPKPPVQDSQSENVSWTTEFFSPILLVEPAIREHTDLAKYFRLHKIEDIPPQICVSLICDIAAGLAALHALKIVHGDVKDENILLFSSAAEGKAIVAKVADFGAAGIDTSREDIRGQSHYWAAPEAIERPPGWEGLRHTPAIDVYSFGLLAATIALNGKPVFDGVDSYTTKMSDKAGRHIDCLLSDAVKDNNDKPISGEKTSLIESVKKLVNVTVTLDPNKRLIDLSKVPEFFDQR